MAGELDAVRAPASAGHTDGGELARTMTHRGGEARLSRSRLARALLLRWPPLVAIAFCGLIGVLLPAAYGSLAGGIPEPGVHDEFSYLLAADTFVHGRLTNPSPPLPEFFEAPHVLVVPTYMSKYPPGQALILALGQKLTGRPIWGVWFSCGLFAASLCWMLQAWIGKPWALAISAVAIATLGVFTYWAQSYWGGMLAACGGALLFGGIRRTCRMPRTIPSILTAVGALILANTRMYEGLLVCIPAGAMLAWCLVRDRRASLRLTITRWLLPFAAVLLIGGSGMAFYNRAVTGSVLSPPYSVHTRQYFDQGVFLFSSLYEPERKPLPRLAAFYQASKHTPDRGWRLITHTARNFYERLPATIESSLGIVDFPEGGRQAYRAVLLWILVFMVAAMGSRWIWFCVGTVLFVAVGQSLVWWWYPHYIAPLVPLVLAALAIALRRTTVSSARTAWPRHVAPAAVAIVAAFYVALPVAAHFLPADRGADLDPRRLRPAAVVSSTRPMSRAEVIQRLTSEGGAHLVFVAYDEDVSVQQGEWVYNPAEFRTAPVLFVHDFGDGRNAELMAFYPDRVVWRLKVAKGQTQLTPYSIR